MVVVVDGQPWYFWIRRKSLFNDVFLRKQIERDILMWNNKTYLKKPVLMKEESALAKHRRWYQQFYSENSPRLDDQGNLFYPNKADVTDW